ncbi:unnamed protein product [Leuciscus chuanchicus]
MIFDSSQREEREHRAQTMVTSSFEFERYGVRDTAEYPSAAVETHTPSVINTHTQHIRGDRQPGGEESERGKERQQKVGKVVTEQDMWGSKSEHRKRKKKR